MSTAPARRVLMIGLDAAEPELIERWTDDGTLPHLARLRAQGSYRRLASSAAWLAGSPWPTFYTGTSPAEHGLYHFLQWRPERRTLVRPRATWLPVEPFWRALGAGRRSLVVDAPMTYPPAPFEGVEISGWASHDHLHPPASQPPDRLARLQGAYGGSLVTEEALGLQAPRALRDLPAELLHAVRCVAEASEGLMRDERWDLGFVTFAATHRGGHKLWDASGMRGPAGPEDDAAMFEALREIYRAGDAAVGRLAEAAGEATRLLVFSLHGMGPNTGRHDLLPALLEAVLTGRAPAAPARPWLQRLRQRLPVEWRHEVKRRLPQVWQDRLTGFWRTAPGGPAARPAFALLSDQQGYLRVDLQGRERAGRVAPGAERDRLLKRIAEGLMSFRDADSGLPLVAAIERSDDLFPAGRRRDLLPDLVVRWSDTPAARHRAVVSDRFGTVPWPTPGRNPDGRAGNHRGTGFLIAAGGGLPAAGDQRQADIRDLAPTVCALLGVAPPWPMEGRPIAALAGQPGLL